MASLYAVSPQRHWGTTNFGVVATEDTNSDTSDLLEALRLEVEKQSSCMKEQLKELFDQSECASAQRHEEVMEGIADLKKTIDGGNQKESVEFNLKRPVEKFVGREDQLERIKDTLQRCNTKVVVSAIAGLGGIGKTELARKYAAVHKEYYQGNVLWIDAENQQSLVTSFYELAKKIGVDIFRNEATGEYRPLGFIVREVYEYFEGTKRLFIFDNVDECSHVEEYIYTISADMHLLITSRVRDWKGADVQVIPLEEFSEEEGVAFVLKALEVGENLKEEHVKELVERLQRLPLALRQAVSYIIQERKFKENFAKGTYGINEYLEEYNSNPKKLLHSDSNNRNINTVYNTWDITIRKIEAMNTKCSKLACQLIRYLAYFAADEIDINECFQKLNQDERVHQEAIGLLNQYSLITCKDSIANVHRLVQFVTRVKLKEEGSERAVLKQCVKLARSWKDESKKANHVISILAYATSYKSIIYYFKVFNRFDITATALRLLIKYGCGRLEINKVKELLAKGVKVDDMNAFLHYVITRNGHMDIIELLINQGADVNVSNYEGNSPLIYALKHELGDVAKLLIKSGADVTAVDNINKMSVFAYVTQNSIDVEYVKLMLEKNIDVNCVNTVGRTLLHYLSISDNAEIAQLLIKKGAQIDIPDKSGDTPLSLALRTKSFEMAEILLGNITNIEEAIKHCPTSLIECYKSYKYDLMSCLLRRGFPLNNEDDFGRTILFYAIEEDILLDVEHFLQEGADIGHVDMEGNTPLSCAASIGHLNTIKYLVKMGAKIDHCNKTGRNILHLAARNGHVDVVKYLIETFVFDTNTTDNGGICPLMSASCFGNLSTVTYLLEKGAKVDLTDNHGDTALHWATIGGQYDIAVCLTIHLTSLGLPISTVNKKGLTPQDCATNLDIINFFITPYLTLSEYLSISK